MAYNDNIYRYYDNYGGNMHSLTVLSAEVTRYRMLAEQLKQDYAGINEETLADTLEGATELPDLLAAIVRSSLLDEALAAALKARLEDMKVRLDRLEERQAKKRRMVCDGMGIAGLDKLSIEDMSISRRQGIPRLEVLNEAEIPPSYLVLQAPRVDRAGLLAALKRGENVAGAKLQSGEPHIQVRTR